ncbi:acyltransferase family protein [Aliarcobacter butzleri]
MEYKFINLFRALAAFWVVIAHCFIWSGWYGFILNPKIAVDLFMIISGYLMTANAFYKHSTEPLNLNENKIKFWLRRFFRLAPSYYFSLFLAVILSQYFLEGYHELQNISPEKWKNTIIYNPLRIDYSIENVLLHLTFLFGLHPAWSFSTFLPDWSLSLEMQFYLIFPILFTFLGTKNLLKKSLLIGIGCFIMGVFIKKYFGYYEPSLIIIKLNYFIVGILSFYFINNKIEDKGKIIFLIVVFSLVSMDMSYGYQLILLPIILLLFIYLGKNEKLSNEENNFFKILLESKFIKFTSDMSYAVYLFHGFFISLFGLIISNIQKYYILQLNERVFFMVVFVVTLSYLFAYVIFIFIEKPGINLGKIVIAKYTKKK